MLLLCSDLACAECDHLRGKFDRLERRYAHAYGVLTSFADTARASEYNRLKATADEARIDSEIARLELEQHRRVHVKVN